MSLKTGKPLKLKLVNDPRPTSTSPKLPLPDPSKVENDLHRTPDQETKKKEEGLIVIGSKAKASVKRKAEEIDMRPHKKERLITSFGEIVTLFVGKNATKLFTHKDMLCAASPVLEAACKSESQSANECVVWLLGDDPKAVKILLNWIYENVIRLPGNDFYRDHPNSTLDLVVKLYVLGDTYLMPELQNDAIDVLADELFMKHGYRWRIMNYAYKATSEKSPLRLFLVKFAIRNWSPDKLESYKTCLCPEFTHSMAVELLKCTSTPRTVDIREEIRDGTFCTLFHRHDSTSKAKCDSLKPWYSCDSIE